jgi:probable addiction module antidote protein
MTGAELSRYNTADYLKKDDDIAAYLEAVMEEGGDDPAYIMHALGVVARACFRSQESVSA